MTLAMTCHANNTMQDLISDLILEHFDQHKEVIKFVETIFVASYRTVGAKPKTGVAFVTTAPIQSCKLEIITVLLE